MSDAETNVELVVVGAGPAGIAAAVRAAESGRRTVLLDESPEVGGQIWRHLDASGLPAVAREWIARLRRSAVEVHCSTSVVDIRAQDDGVLLRTERRGAPWLVRAQSLVLATGARERFLPFPGWTLPGVFGIGGAQALLKAGMRVRDARVVIAGSGPLLLPVAALLAANGARVQLVAEQAGAANVARFAMGLWRRPATLLQAARYRAAFGGTRYSLGTWITAARGEGVVQEIDVTDGMAIRTLACDMLCAAFGLVPGTELARLAGCSIERGGVVVSGAQETTVRGVYSAGECTGVGGVDLALAEGEIAGLAAAGTAAPRSLLARRTAFRRMAARMDEAFALRDELRTIATRDTIVCRCEDVRVGAIDPGWTPRQAKLYTRAGMGPCQGRVCGAALEFLHGWPVDAVRLPTEPVRISTLIAGAAAVAPSGEQGA